MGAIDEGLIVELLRSEIDGLRAIYLFGSRARSEAGAASDTDVAVLRDLPLDNVDRWRVQERLAQRLHTDVDLVDLRSASTVLRLQVVARGRVLFEADPVARETFEDMVFAAYARLNESRREIIEDARARGRVYG